MDGAAESTTRRRGAQRSVSGIHWKMVVFAIGILVVLCAGSLVEGAGEALMLGSIFGQIR